MNALEELLSLIPEHEVTSERLGGDAKVSLLLASLVETNQIGNAHLRTALLHVLMRAVESYLLADHVVLEVARYPDVYLGRADAVIRERINGLLGIEPPTNLVSHLRKCLTGHMARVGKKAALSLRHVNALFREVASGHPRRELRCAICGYHFQRTDMGDDRRELADDIGLVFAEGFDPGRLNDDMKPHKFSRLEVDHVVPEEGLGWTDVDNLQIACQFCNTGRLIFRRSLEPLSTMMAGALSAFPPSRAHQITRQVIVVSALRVAGLKCTQCAAPAMDRELTAQLDSDGEPARMWCVPWNLRVTCYRCWAT
jgi:hypothetical protein